MKGFLISIGAIVSIALAALAIIPPGPPCTNPPCNVKKCTTPGCGGGDGVTMRPGTYKIQVSLSVRGRKSGGHKWDAGWGRVVRPDLFGNIWVGDKRLYLWTRKNRYSTTWKPRSKKYQVEVTGREDVRLKFWDRDISDHDFIGKCQGRIMPTLEMECGLGSVRVRFVPIKDEK